MRRSELRELIRTADLYKMSLGKSAAYRAEALQSGHLVFQSEVNLFDAVVAGDREGISAAAARVKAENYPKANAPENAWSIWCRSIETFRTLPARTLVLHWEAEFDHLHWGIVSDESFFEDRREDSDYGQLGYIFHRPLIGGWRRTSVNDVPISNLHPKARDLAINMATLNRVQTHTEYFRAVLLDEETSQWYSLPDWQEKAHRAGWHPKRISELRNARRRRLITPQVKEIADHFEAEIKRMADTALKTAEYANGQTVLRVVKEKEIGFAREELEDEIADLLREQGYRCALTDYDFKRPTNNPHLRPSLDRIDSARGYVAGNLQVVTRAANFYKSASDADDWAMKAMALEKMAVAIQRRRREQLPEPAVGGSQ
jgi:hypothetical protein